MDVGVGLLWLVNPMLGVRGDVRYRVGLTEPESLASMWRRPHDHWPDHRLLT